MRRSIFSRHAWAYVAALLALPATGAIAQKDIINYSKSDGRMNAAMVKSVAALPTFDAALEQHRLAILNVRVPYGTDGNEFVWLTDVRRDADGGYDGIITDVVAHVTYLHQGSSYHARRDQVADWMYRDEKGGDHGGWTVRLMQEDSPDLRARNKFHFVD